MNPYVCPGCQRIGLNLRELALTLGMSESHVRKCVEDDILPPPRAFGTKSIFLVEEVMERLMGLPARFYGREVEA